MLVHVCQLLVLYMSIYKYHIIYLVTRTERWFGKIWLNNNTTFYNIITFCSQIHLYCELYAQLLFMLNLVDKQLPGIFCVIMLHIDFHILLDFTNDDRIKGVHFV